VRNVDNGDDGDNNNNNNMSKALIRYKIYEDTSKNENCPLQIYKTL
jgi:hypothetical protein